MITTKYWQEDFVVRSFEMNPQGKAHFSTICNYLQEGASMHAEKAGFGFENMAKSNQTWVLARMKIDIARFPIWKENIRLKTWSRGREGAFYLRDFKIYDHTDTSIVKASSSWAAINTKSRRPGLVKNLENGLFTVRESVFNEPLGKLQPPGEQKLLRKYVVSYSDIDLVYHVNNVKYIELMLDSLPNDCLMKRSIRQMQINYLGEAALGDELEIFSSDVNEQEQTISVVRRKDTKAVCRAKVSWK